MQAFHVRAQDEIGRAIERRPFDIMAELPEVLQKERIAEVKDVHTRVKRRRQSISYIGVSV
ncbi:hypothetical protein NSND_60244 [Nitrospira sp. ND1]|jgi:hypothetical protein|nr:hypothetical protein NSND_60244 [Nitrospira sp. ND1]